MLALPFSEVHQNAQKVVETVSKIVLRRPDNDGFLVPILCVNAGLMSTLGTNKLYCESRADVRWEKTNKIYI